MDQFLGTFLRVGVVTSAVIVLAGAALFLSRRGGELCDYNAFHGEPAQLRHPVGIVRAAAAMDDRGIIAIGLLVLIATPVTRVALSMLGFARQRDGLYVVLTAIVLAVLTYSLIGG
jgi:uncharacterized membrane protein